MIPHTSRRPSASILAVLAASLLLSACATTADMIQANPDLFNLDVEGPEISGTYNPAGFETAQVRKLLGYPCGGPPVEYAETPGPVLTTFKARCAAAGPVTRKGAMAFLRKGSQIEVSTLAPDERGQLTIRKELLEP